MEGLVTIKASGVQNILMTQFDKHQDLNSSTGYMYIAASRAYGFFSDQATALYMTTVILILLIFSGKSSNI